MTQMFAPPLPLPRVLSNAIFVPSGDLIGARLSKLRLVRSFVDLGGRRGMTHMLDYLVKHPEKGCWRTRWASRRSCSTGAPRGRRSRPVGSDHR
jgi:hypothetical protein